MRRSIPAGRDGRILCRAASTLEHRQAKARCENVPSWFPDEMREFGQTFADLQSKRHFADYDPDYPVRKSDVVADIDDARAAMDRFLARPASDRRNFAIHVMMKVRTNAAPPNWSRKARGTRPTSGCGHNHENGASPLVPSGKIGGNERQVREIMAVRCVAPVCSCPPPPPEASGQGHGSRRSLTSGGHAARLRTALAALVLAWAALASTPAVDADDHGAPLTAHSATPTET